MGKHAVHPYNPNPSANLGGPFLGSPGCIAQVLSAAGPILAVVGPVVVDAVSLPVTVQNAGDRLLIMGSLNGVQVVGPVTVNLRVDGAIVASASTPAALVGPVNVSLNFTTVPLSAGAHTVSLEVDPGPAGVLNVVAGGATLTVFELC